MDKNETITEMIMRAVHQLEERGVITFARKDIRDELGLHPDKMNTTFSPIFQGMRVTHPDGAPLVGRKFQDVFERVEHGKYQLTKKGSKLIEELFN